MKNVSLTVFAVLVWTATLFAQQITQTAEHSISSKAAAGEWIDYCIDPSTGDIHLSFKTKSKKREYLVEHYQFSPNLELTSSESLTVPNSQVVQCGAVASPQNQGETATRALRISRNLTSLQMILETGTIVYGQAGSAVITTFHTEQKVKPKGEDGEKFLLLHSRTQADMVLTTSMRSHFGNRTGTGVTSTTFGLGKLAYNVGDVMALVYTKSDRPFHKFGYVVYDAKTLARKKFVPLEFDKAYRAMHVRDMPNGDFAMILAPVMEQDFAGRNKANVNFHQTPMFKYIRIDTEGRLVDEVDFELPKSKMGVPYHLTVVPSDDPEQLHAYIMGGGNGDTQGMGYKEMTAAMNSWHVNEVKGAGTPKSNQVLVGKVGDGKVHYMHLMQPENVLTNVQLLGKKTAVPSGKDLGKFFTYDNPRVLSAVTLNGTDYLTCAGAVNGYLYTLELAADGTIANTYLSFQKKTHYAEAVCMLNSEGHVMQLVSHQPLGSDESETAKNNQKRSLVATRLQGVGTAPHSSLLPEKSFVDPVNPIRILSSGELLVLGHPSSKELTFCKVRL